MKWYKRDPDAALSGMIGLSLEERAVYNTVIDLLYSRDGELPTDDTFFSRACECRPQVWRRVRDALIAKGKLHYRDDGKLTANRVEKELQTARKLITKMADLGRVSSEKRNEIKVAEATARGTHPQPQPQPDKESVRGAKTARDAIEPKFEEFKKEYPSRGSASNPSAPARKAFAVAVLNGADPDRIIAAVKAGVGFDRKKIGTEFIPRATTYLHERRWEDYAPPSACAKPVGVHVKTDTPQWRAWVAHMGRAPPQDRNFGWFFPTEWPPTMDVQNVA